MNFGQAIHPNEVEKYRAWGYDVDDPSDLVAVWAEPASPWVPASTTIDKIVRHVKETP